MNKYIETNKVNKVDILKINTPEDKGYRAAMLHADLMLQTNIKEINKDLVKKE